MKHRDNLFLVVRNGNVACAAYKTLDAAQNAADAYRQQFLDRGGYPDVTFDVQITTFYNE